MIIEVENELGIRFYDVQRVHIRTRHGTTRVEYQYADDTISTDVENGSKVTVHGAGHTRFFQVRW